MSYQRWSEGDAYVIGVGNYRLQVVGALVEPGFQCVACSHHRTYREIIAHLETHHHNSAKALEALRKEAEVVGLDVSWDAYLPVPL